MFYLEFKRSKMLTLIQESTNSSEIHWLIKQFWIFAPKMKNANSKYFKNPDWFTMIQNSMVIHEIIFEFLRHWKYSNKRTLLYQCVSQLFLINFAIVYSTFKDGNFKIVHFDDFSGFCICQKTLQFSFWPRKSPKIDLLRTIQSSRRLRGLVRICSNPWQLQLWQQSFILLLWGNLVALWSRVLQC